MGRAFDCKGARVSTFSNQGVNMDKIKGRISEPSTWAGFIGILEGLKLVLPAYSGLITGLQAIVGAVGVLAREKGGPGVK